MDQLLRADMTVDMFLDQYPQATQVLIRHGMACAGCFISRFHTLAQVAAIYGVNEHDFLDELHRCIEQIEQSASEGIDAAPDALDD